LAQIDRSMLIFITLGWQKKLSPYDAPNPAKTHPLPHRPGEPGPKTRKLTRRLYHDGG
jgi:hypothetical protein